VAVYLDQMVHFRFWIKAGPVLNICRSVCEDMDDVRGEEGGEEEDRSERENAESDVQRLVHLRRAVRAHQADVVGRQRYGLRPNGTQRGYRSAGSRHQERPDRDEALERDVRQDSAAGHPVAHPQGLRLVRARAAIGSRCALVGQ